MTDINTEIFAVSSLNKKIAVCDLLGANILEGEKTIALDGCINVFSKQGRRKRDFYFGVPVQVKGRRMTRPGGKNKTYPIEVSDLLVYSTKQGVLYFLVCFDNEGKSVNYYCGAFLKGDIDKLIRDAGKQQTKSVALPKIDMSPEKLQEMIIRFAQAMKAQQDGVSRRWEECSESENAAVYVDANLPNRRSDNNKWGSHRRKMINWLSGLNVRWSVTDTAQEVKYANLCEVLDAFKVSGYDRLKPAVYNEAFTRMVENKTARGLSSVSLDKETVVVTSMMLILAAEQYGSSALELEPFERIAETLWSIRNEQGWGVYVERMNVHSYATTLRALIALSYYRVGKTEAYKGFCQRLFEKTQNGTLDFNANDEPRLVTTSLSLILFYIHGSEFTKGWKNVFDTRGAVKYIIEHKEIQVEQEIIWGLEMNGGKVYQAPWNHITIGFSTEAVCRAFFEGDAEECEISQFRKYMKRLLKENVVEISSGKEFYHPQGLTAHPDGHFTYPATYLIKALSWLENATLTDEGGEQ